jgi:hypothetical protein
LTVNRSPGENAGLGPEPSGEVGSMWIFDSYYKGCVELWARERSLKKVSIAYPPSFHMHLNDPATHIEMIGALESRYKVEDCSFRTIYAFIIFRLNL